MLMYVTGMYNEIRVDILLGQAMKWTTSYTCDCHFSQSKDNQNIYRYAYQYVMESGTRYLAFGGVPGTGTGSPIICARYWYQVPVSGTSTGTLAADYILYVY